MNGSVYNAEIRAFLHCIAIYRYYNTSVSLSLHFETIKMGGYFMFDEKSSRWIRIYRGVTIAIFFVFAAFGLIAGIGDASAEFMDIGIGGDDDGFLDFIVWLIIGGGIGFIQLVVNMLVIQLLNNVQIIRENLEK